MLTYDQLMQPQLDKLKELGGTADIHQLYKELLPTALSDEPTINIDSLEPSLSKQAATNLQFARTYLKKGGLIDYTDKKSGIWFVTEKGANTQQVDVEGIKRQVQEERAKKENAKKSKTKKKKNVEDRPTPESSFQPWKAEVKKYLTDEVSLNAFEALTKKLLNKLGFNQVQITRRIDKKGVEGQGISCLNHMMSFQVPFKAYKDGETIGREEIKKFRSTIEGNSDRGLVITTGDFTPSVYKEATRNGQAPIHLIDGTELAEKLKEFGLGVETKLVEETFVDEDWFSELARKKSEQSSK